MATKGNKSIAEQLNTAEIRISNSLSNEDVKAEVAKKGYTEEKLLEGKSLVDSARQAVKNQVSMEGAAQNATANEKKSKKEAHKAYQDFAQIARAKFKPKSPELAKLGLTGSEPASTAAFIKSGYTLFDNAANDPEILNVVKDNGYTVETLTGEKAKITAYDNANSDQVSAIGTAKKATELQTLALQAMNDWVGEYTKIAKVALSSNKKLLEKIGVFTGKRTKGTKNKGNNDNTVNK